MDGTWSMDDEYAEDVVREDAHDDRYASALAEVERVARSNDVDPLDDADNRAIMDHIARGPCARWVGAIQAGMNTEQRIRACFVCEVLADAIDSGWEPGPDPRAVAQRDAARALGIDGSMVRAVARASTAPGYL